MISHTVYRGRNNEIDLQLLSNNAPLETPAVIDSVEITVTSPTLADVLSIRDTESGGFVVYDDTDGTINMRLGRIDSINDLPDGNYEVEVTGYGGPDNDEGIAFGSFLMYLRTWAGEIPDATT